MSCILYTALTFPDFGSKALDCPFTLQWLQCLHDRAGIQTLNLSLDSLNLTTVTQYVVRISIPTQNSLTVIA